MKALLSFLILFTGYAQASDQLKNEIICHKRLVSGEADSGLTLILQSNPTAWAKNVVIIENGYVGPKKIANVQVPLLPVVRSSRGYIPEDIMSYESDRLLLQLRVLQIDGRPLNGGSANISLPNYESETIDLDCKYVE